MKIGSENTHEVSGLTCDFCGAEEMSKDEHGEYCLICFHSRPTGPRYCCLWQLCDAVGVDSSGLLCNRLCTGERELTFALNNMGLTVLRWSMGESDSFGPLSRIAVVELPCGRVERFVYG